ncbi:MAG: hypothetical protein GFGODING_02212 [Flavobacteriales bacterium]|nr:hypothetical protein [Flavobacteriales bacterium]
MSRGSLYIRQGAIDKGRGTTGSPALPDPWIGMIHTAHEMIFHHPVEGR